MFLGQRQSLVDEAQRVFAHQDLGQNRLEKAFGTVYSLLERAKDSVIHLA